MFGDRLACARAAAGLSMRALGEQIGVSANMIKKYEHNLSMPSSGKVIKLAHALNVRSEYFFRTMKIELKNVEYRKRSNTLKGVLKRIKADVMEQAERWQELVNLYPRFPVPEFKIPPGLPQHVGSLDDIDALADKVRSAWELGFNPIPDLIDTLESKGLMVVVTGKANRDSGFDGLQAAVANQPLIVISEHWPGDRQRFTLAHELGHLLLHGRLPPHLDEEKACHRFAGSFLLPARSARQHLGDQRLRVEVQELHLLKMEFGLSMQACMRRAADLNIISDLFHVKLLKGFSRRGWRKQEPGSPYPKEKTRLFRQLVYRALSEGLVGESKAAELLGIPLMKFHQQRKLELPDAAAIA